MVAFVPLSSVDSQELLRQILDVLLEEAFGRLGLPYVLVEFPPSRTRVRGLLDLGFREVGNRTIGARSSSTADSTIRRREIVHSPCCVLLRSDGFHRTRDPARENPSSGLRHVTGIDSSAVLVFHRAAELGRVVPTAAVPAGTAIMANVGMAARRYVRADARFDLDSASHFDKNETRARLERREVTVVVRPFAIVEVDLTA